MINRLHVEQHTFADGVIAALAKTLKGARGICEQIEVVVNNNTGDATATVTITSDLSGQLYTKAGIPENATTAYKARGLAGTTDSDFPAFLCSGADLTVTATPSGDPGASGMTVDVYVYLRTEE